MPDPEMHDPRPLPPRQPPSKSEEGNNSQEMVRKVGSSERRLREAKARGKGEWFRSLALLGVVGWSVTIPTLAAVALGMWIDHKWPGGFSWTLFLLFIGLAIGCGIAWAQIREESKR